MFSLSVPSSESLVPRNETTDESQKKPPSSSGSVFPGILDIFLFLLGYTYFFFLSARLVDFLHLSPACMQFRRCNGVTQLNRNAQSFAGGGFSYTEVGGCDVGGWLAGGKKKGQKGLSLFRREKARHNVKLHSCFR